MSESITRTDQADFFCADLSRETGEPMIGTAPAAETWFLLEYGGPWSAKATEDNDLPPATQAWLAGALALADKGRLQFIKRNRTSPAAGITFFLALAREVQPVFYEFHLDSYADLQSLDLAGLLAGDAGRQYLRSEPLYLVCTNGRRDRCCARLGLSLSLALDEQVGDAAWQTTHLGGHRFAPTLVTFPDGFCYGRLEATDLPPLVRAQEAGQLYLDRLRGRSCYEGLIQAADAFLRHETGQLSPEAYHLLGVQPTADNVSVVSFSEPATAAIHRLTIQIAAVTRPVSCSPAKNKSLPHFELILTTREPLTTG